MEKDRDVPNRPWDTCRELPNVNDDMTPWKILKLVKIVSIFLVGVLVFGLALCSKASFLILITLSNEGTRTLPDEQKPVALLCIGCSLVASSVLLILKSFWKACYKSSKLPRKSTIALVLFFEFIVSFGAAVLTIVAMPHLDIVTNVTIFNGVAVISALLQVVTQGTARERKRFIIPSITALIFILIGFALFVFLYVVKAPTDTKMATWVGLAVGGAFLVSFNWWESYFRVISQNSNNIFLMKLCRDLTRCQNVLHIISSVLRIAVTAGVLGAYVPLSKMDWKIVTAIPERETRIIAIAIGVQLISSALCHWFAIAACKMHAVRRCFITPLYMSSLAVMALLVIPVIVYYQDFRKSLNGTGSSVDFSGYCNLVVDGRNHSLDGSVFDHLVLDVTHTLCFLDMSKITDIGLLTGAAVAWWLGLVLATVHLWYLNIYRIQRTQDLFIRRLYEGAFIEQSLLLNTRFDVQTKAKTRKPLEMSMVYLCATMWHETYSEMMNIIISIFRLDKYRPKTVQKFEDFTFEAHIYFDDSFEYVDGSSEPHLNKYARNLVEILTEVHNIFTNIDGEFFQKEFRVLDQRVIKTPYGGRLVVTMPHGNQIIVHLKNKDLVRHKKRWSQVMYLYYLLGWKLMSKYHSRWQKGENDKSLKAEVQKEKHNIYLLALDGDTDFQPASVMLLIDRLKMYPRVGAVCGRIHPTGSGPAVWFQKFEYAVSHWLQKTAEHVIGSVLCSPGCFSLFRAEALMDDNVMKRYSTKSTEASHFIQYDQGEDRWLCTLLLKQGWRVEYNAASDAYTNAPGDFKELYNQRRRWGPSTMANLIDILGSSGVISKKNSSMSKPFMLYQLFAITSAVLAPATICLMVAGSLSFIFNLNGNTTLVLAVIPPLIFLILCFNLKSDTQITVAAIFSCFYAFLMLVVMLSIIGSMMKDNTILTPSSIFIISMAIIYVSTALLHPLEIHLLFHGFLYILCIPSAYLILTIYSMVNMNNVSWGTREDKPQPKTTQPAETDSQQSPVQKAKSSFQRFFSGGKCCKKPEQISRVDRLNVSQNNLIPETSEPELQPQNTIVEDIRLPEEEQRQVGPVFNFPAQPAQCWVTHLQDVSSNMQLQEDKLSKDEDDFWKDLLEKYLKPLPDDKEGQKKIATDLKDLRNQVNFAFFMLNALWLVATFTLQLFEASISITIPKVNLDLDVTEERIKIDPIGFMFIVGFATSVIIQFLAMIYHRIYTLIHYVAFLETEPLEKKPKDEDEIYLPGKKVDSKSMASSVADSMSVATDSLTDSFDSDFDDDSDDDFPSALYTRSDGGGTMV